MEQFKREFDEATLAQINGRYECPADAGPDWRAAMKAGLDMSLVEDALSKTPAERFAEHQAVLDFLLAVQAAGQPNVTK
jgi:hypothetical protein